MSKAALAPGANGHAYRPLMEGYQPGAQSAQISFSVAASTPSKPPRGGSSASRPVQVGNTPANMVEKK